MTTSPDVVVSDEELDELLTDNDEVIIDWSADYAIGAKSYAEEKYLDAAAHFDRAARLAIEPREFALARFSSGAACIEAGQTARGRDAIESAVRSFSGFYVRALLWLGRADLEQGDADAAASLLNEYRVNNPADAEAAFWLGRARLEQGDAESAFTLFTEAESGYSDSPSFHHWIGVAALLRQDYDRAFAWLNRAIELNPANADSYYQLARLCILRGDVEQASVYAGDLWLLGGDLARATALMNEVYRAAATNPIVRRQLGRLKLAAGQFDGATSLLASVAENPSATATDHAYFGWTLLATGNSSGAETAFNAALAMDSKHAFAAEGRAWLTVMQGQSSSPWKEGSEATPTGKFSGLGASGIWAGGLRVLLVADGSPAQQIGIKPGDLLTEIDGVALDCERDWDNILGEYSNSEPVFVGWRDTEGQRFAAAQLAGHSA